MFVFSTAAISGVRPLTEARSKLHRDLANASTQIKIIQFILEYLMMFEKRSLSKKTFDIKGMFTNDTDNFLSQGLLGDNF